MAHRSSIVAIHTLQPKVAELCISDARDFIRAVSIGDFQDIESGRVLTSAAVAMAPELGRQAARELWARLMRGTK